MAEDLVHLWYVDRASRAIGVAHPVESEGVYDRHVGPRWLYAKVRFRFEPANLFIVAYDLPSTEVTRLQVDNWLDEAVFGVLDICALREAPIIKMCVRVIGVEDDPVRSTRSAFRGAGRKAAEAILTTLGAGDPHRAADPAGVDARKAIGGEEDPHRG